MSIEQEIFDPCEEGTSSSEKKESVLAELLDGEALPDERTLLEEALLPLKLQDKEVQHAVRQYLSDRNEGGRRLQRLDDEIRSRIKTLIQREVMLRLAELRAKRAEATKRFAARERKVAADRVTEELGRAESIPEQAWTLDPANGSLRESDSDSSLLRLAKKMVGMSESQLGLIADEDQDVMKSMESDLKRVEESSLNVPARRFAKELARTLETKEESRQLAAEICTDRPLKALTKTPQDPTLRFLARQRAAACNLPSAVGSPAGS